MKSPDTQQLPHLIRLLEDESIRDQILKQLQEFGPGLELALKRQGIPLTSRDALLIRPLLDDEYREWIPDAWTAWINPGEESAQLEEALSLIAQFQYGRMYPETVGRKLDALADEFDARYTQRDPMDLAEFLFQGYALRGIEQEHYYSPLNSNLLHVIDAKAGIPISLACIYILVGNRLGLTISGCNFPGHFLAVASTQRKNIIVDCFNGGMCIDREALAAIEAGVTEEDILRLRCTTPDIIARVLRNLINAYQREGSEKDARIMNDLLTQVEESLL